MMAEKLQILIGTSRHKKVICRKAIEEKYLMLQRKTVIIKKKYRQLLFPKACRSRGIREESTQEE